MTRKPPHRTTFSRNGAVMAVWRSEGVYSLCDGETTIVKRGRHWYVVRDGKRAWGGFTTLQQAIDSIAAEVAA